MNYKYTSIKVIDGKIKAVVNKEEYPNYRYEIFEWQQNHEIFEFANYNEHNKMFCELVNITGKLEFDKQLQQGIEVTCIEIKEGFAWFKEEKKYSFENYKNQLDPKCDEQCFYNCSQASSIEPQCIKESIIKFIAQRIKYEQRKHEVYNDRWSEIAARKIYSCFNITKKSHENEQ